MISGMFRFPIYPLEGDVEEDICKSYRLKGLNVEDLPNLPRQVFNTLSITMNKFLSYLLFPI